MTEPLATMLAPILAASLTWTLPPAPAWAAPAEASVEAAEASEPEAAVDAAAVEAALADGDLTRARELAVALREAEPTPAHHRLEARVWEALGDYEQAAAALDRAAEALDEGDDAGRSELEDEQVRVEALARGSVADEPASDHRERLDDERAARLAALAPKPSPPPPVIDVAPKREPITKKWYFWVTLGAIVASAGAIVGIAVSSNLDDRNSDAASRLGATGPLGSGGPGGVVFRF